MLYKKYQFVVYMDHKIFVRFFNAEYYKNIFAH